MTEDVPIPSVLEVIKRIDHFCFCISRCNVEGDVVGERGVNKSHAV